jgi:hypothetical protein
MKAKALAAIDKIAAKRGIPRETVIGGYVRAVKEDAERAERQRIERETRDAAAQTKPYDVHAELRESEAALDRMQRELEERQAAASQPSPTIKFQYADGSPAEWTHDELLGIMQSIRDELRSGKSLNPLLDRAKLEDGNRLLREHGLGEVEYA